MYLLTIYIDLPQESLPNPAFVEFITVYAGLSEWAGSVLIGTSEW